MKRYAGRLILFMTAILTIVPVGVAVAQTQDEYLGFIKTRCEATKQLIDEQRRSDLVARINKGRAYQAIIDQQNAFSLRLRNNKVTTDAFDREITAVQDNVNGFRSAYNRYDDAVATLMSIDCQTKPQEFSDQLQLARSYRLVIGNQVATIDTELAKYRQIVVEFQKELERLNGTVSGGNQ